MYFSNNTTNHFSNQCICKNVVVMGNFTEENWKNMKGEHCEGDVFPFHIPISLSLKEEREMEERRMKKGKFLLDKESGKKKNEKVELVNRDLFFHFKTHWNDFPQSSHLCNVQLSTCLLNDENFLYNKGYTSEYKELFEKSDYIIICLMSPQYSSQNGEIDEEINLSQTCGEINSIEKDEKMFFSYYNLIISSLEDKFPEIIFCIQNEKNVSYKKWLNEFNVSPFPYIVDKEKNIMERLALYTEKKYFV